MADEVTGVSSGSAVGAAGVGGAEGGPNGKVDMNMQISSAEELKKKAPEVWRALLEGIAMSICNRMKQRNDHLKKLMRESQRGGR